MSNKKIQKAGAYTCLGIASLFSGYLAYQFLFPATPSNAASTATAQINVDVEPTLEMALSSDRINLEANGESEILPGAGGVLATGDIDIYVTSNGANGYSLSVYTANDTNAMKHINTNVNASIAATSGGLTELADDTWGYKSGSSTNWMAVGAGAENKSFITNGAKTDSICDDISTDYASCPSGSVNVHNVTFGAKVTDSLPSGRYTNDVVFSVVAEGGSGN